jgi:predicted nicotinamide N-methyase
MNPEPFLVATPTDAIPHLLREKVFIEGKTFLIERPGDSDRVIDHPVVQEAHRVDEYMPYWTDLWPASRMMAKAILREPWEQFPVRVGDKIEALEIGCGLGLPGLAALSRGLKVIFSDYDETAVKFAANNARLNGFKEFRTLPFDWRVPPEELKVPVVIASDLTYEERNIEPILQLLRKVLLPGGICFLTDQDRTPAPVLRQELARQGFKYTKEMLRAGEPGGDRVKGTLYRISLPAG